MSYGRTEYIRDKMQKHWDYLKSAGYEVAALFLQGSQNYNLDIYTHKYTSDIDTKAIILPTLEQIVNSTSPISYTHVMPDDSHIDIKDIRIMIDMWEKQNISYLELLFTDFYIVNPLYAEYISRILYMKDSIVEMHQNQLLRCIQGMSGNKVKALEHPYPTIADKPDFKEYGYDKKQLHHIIRLCDFTYRWINTKDSFKDLYTPQGELAETIYWHKFNNTNIETARELATKYHELTNTMIREYIAKHPDTINEATKKQMHDIKVDMIRFALKKELIDNE